MAVVRRPGSHRIRQDAAAPDGVHDIKQKYRKQRRMKNGIERIRNQKNDM